MGRPSPRLGAYKVFKVEVRVYGFGFSDGVLKVYRIGG